ncbi:MAG: YifB family Mg chelatase-like AAA ATPase [Candidatus Andersenbacteria bacterium]
MPAHIHSAALHGIEAAPVEVEVDVLPGLPSFTVVGLGDKAIQESRERLTAALINLGYKPPRRKTIVSLAPASLKKEGSLYDLAITVGFLCASKQITIAPKKLERTWFVGELGLDGTIRPVRGVLPIVLAARHQGITTLYVPAGNAEEASAGAEELKIYAVPSLQAVITHLDDKQPRTLEPLRVLATTVPWAAPEIDFADIKGQDHAKRALIIAAAGQHNVLLVGPPGTGKTLLARALPGILPPLSREESYTVTSLYSVAGELPSGTGLLKQRPFRNPHYGASSVALVGGGTWPRPGEVSLAHGGVLFLDELPEFPRSVLDQLRQPIEDGWVTVARSAHTVRYPARSMLVGAMNPCKCGFLGSERKACQCAPSDVVRYQRRISGPLLDRFDIHVSVPDVSLGELLADQPTGKTSQEIAALVAAARERQYHRQGKPNSHLRANEMRVYAPVDARNTRLLEQAEAKFHLSARSVHRLLKVALTIADLADRDAIDLSHLAEALQYREQLRQYLPDFV